MDGGFDEAFGFSVGSRGVGPGETVFDVVLNEYLVEEHVSVAWPVVSEQALDRDAEPGEVDLGHMEEADRRLVSLVGQDGSKAEP